jgi:hypothetical protein
LFPTFKSCEAHNTICESRDTILNHEQEEAGREDGPCRHPSSQYGKGIRSKLVSHKDAGLYSSLASPAFWSQAKSIEVRLNTTMSGAFWSHDDDECLRQLALSGLSLAAVAAEMERSKSAIRFRALKLKIAIARDRNAMQNPAKISIKVG